MQKNLHLPCGIVACAFIATSALAQTPGPADPSRLGERFDEALPPSPQTVPPASLGQAPLTKPLSPTQFVLRDVSVEGSTVYDAADLAPLSLPFIGTQVSEAQLAYLANAITAKYRADGYLIAFALVGPSQPERGVARIKVVEGYVADVKIEGEIADRRGLIRRIAEKAIRGRPTRRQDLERAVLLVEDLPGVSARTTFLPSSQGDGALTLVLQVSRQRLGGFAAVDNRGSRAIGPVQLSAGFEANSLLGLNEQTALVAATAAETEELAYLAVKHEETLTPGGLRLTLSGSVSRAEPGGALTALDAVGEGEAYGVRLSAPLVRSRARTFVVGVAFDYLNTTTEFSGSPYSEDRVRAVSLDATFDATDHAFGASHPASSRVRTVLTRGLDLLDASDGSPGPSRAGAEPDFTKLNVDTLRVQTLGARASVALALSGQVAGGPLFSSQQFGLGGLRFGRGYEPSELIGDHGIGASIEGRYALPSARLISAPELYAFYEGGAVWMKAPTVEGTDGRSLASAGFGVRFGLGRRVTIQLELAKPLTRAIASRGDKDVRPLFSIATRF